MRVPDPGCQQGAYGNADGEMPDLGSRASSPPTTCQVLLGGLWEEGHPEPLNQFKQEELVYIMQSIIQANCYSLNDRVHRPLSRLATVKCGRKQHFILTVTLTRTGPLSRSLAYA